MIDKLPLPTDNLYKFMALFGLILFIFSYVILFKADELLKKTYDLEAEYSKLEMEKIYNSVNIRKNLGLSEKFSKDVEKLKQTDSPEIQECLESIQNSEPINPKYLTDEFQDKIDKYMKKAVETDKTFLGIVESSKEMKPYLFKEIDYGNMRKKLSADIDDIGTRLHYHYLLKYISIGLMLAGFGLWYFKLQKYQDMIIKEQALQKVTPKKI